MTRRRGVQPGDERTLSDERRDRDALLRRVRDLEREVVLRFEVLEIEVLRLRDEIAGLLEDRDG